MRPQPKRERARFLTITCQMVDERNGVQRVRSWILELTMLIITADELEPLAKRYVADGGPRWTFALFVFGMKQCFIHFASQVKLEVLDNRFLLPSTLWATFCMSE